MNQTQKQLVIFLIFENELNLWMFFFFLKLEAFNSENILTIGKLDIFWGEFQKSSSIPTRMEELLGNMIPFWNEKSDLSGNSFGFITVSKVNFWDQKLLLNWYYENESPDN